MLCCGTLSYWYVVGRYRTDNVFLVPCLGVRNLLLLLLLVVEVMLLLLILEALLLFLLRLAQTHLVRSPLPSCWFCGVRIL